MNDPAPLHRAFPRRGRSLLRRLLPAIAALLVLIGLGAYLLVTNALSQDADVQARSRTFIARSLEQQRNEVGRNIINYSKWGEAYRHLHLTVDKVWADDHRNVGDIPFDLYGYNGVWVVDGAGRTVYGVIDGKPTPRRITDWLQGDVAGLLAAARKATYRTAAWCARWKWAGCRRSPRRPPSLRAGIPPSPSRRARRR